MEVRILGPLEVWEGSEPLVVDSPRQRALLALLAIHANEAVSVDRIVDDLWGGSPPASARSSVRYHMSKLRSSLGDAAVHVVTRSPGYVLELSPDSIDAHRFEHAAAEGRRLIAEDPVRAGQRLTDALNMWRGSALSDFTYETFAHAEITRLEELRLSVLEDRIDADLASARHRELVGEMESLVARYPLRERLWGQLMRALYAAGRQAEALRAFQTARRTLGEIGIEPSEALREIEERVLQQDPSLLPIRRPRRRHNLPERVSTFVGREHEIEQVRVLLEQRRLVTLTGIGGVGKTSFAVEAGRRLVADYGDGVWLVGLADMADPSVLPERIASVLGFPTQPMSGLLARIGEYLSRRSALLIFDGCERYIDTAASHAESLLSMAPELRVMATSRELLEVAGECRFEVPLLETDGIEADAVRLFADRAALVRPGFAVTEANLGVIENVCRRVAGIPLAVELAASRLSVLSLDEISQHLDDQMNLLTQGRRAESPHGSLRAVLDWSHDLLNPSERILLRRLSVFQGGATLPAVEQVCADDAPPADAILNLLARLVEVSLVVKDPETARFEMLDPVLQYAAQHLADAGEASDIQRRHASCYREVAQSLFEAEFTPAEVEKAETRVRDQSNLVAALSWELRSGDPALAVAMAAHLAGQLLVVDRLLDPLLDAARRQPSREAVILLTHAAFLRVGWIGLSLAEEAVAMARDLGDEYALGRALTRLGSVVGWGGDFGRGAAITREALELFDRMGHPEAMRCLVNLAGMLVRVQGGLAEAAAAARKLQVRAVESGSIIHQALAHQALGWVASNHDELNTARVHLQTALVMQAEVRAYRWIAMGLTWLIDLELAAGNIAQAVAYHEELGSQFREFWGGMFLSIDAKVQIALGDVAGGIVTLLDELEQFAPTSEIEVEVALRELGRASVLAGKWVTAVRLYAAAEAIRERRNLGLAIHEARQVEADDARLRSELGGDTFESEWRRGQEMTIDEIAAYARQSLQPLAADRSRPG